MLILALAACGSDTSHATTPAPTAQSTKGAQPTQVTAEPTVASPSTSQANEFIKLVQIAPVYGKVTDATLTPHDQGKVGVGFDVTINNPTQSRVKHVSYEILSTILQVNNVDVVSISFHADGYTDRSG